MISFRRPNYCLLLLAVMWQVQGCSSLVASQTGKFADGLSSAIYNNNDVASVGQAIPTFLVLVDSMIERSPDSAELLKTGAQLYDAYGGVFVEDPVRKERLSDRSLAYAERGVCAWDDDFCALRTLDFEAFDAAVAKLDEDDLPYAYALAVSWLNWIRVHSDDWNALADLPRPERIIARVLELDDTYDDGMAELYAGALATLLPPALGGKPEVGRAHFERSLEVSEGRNMMVKVVYAEQYARLKFDQELHNRLLTEVVQGDPNIDGLVLLNTVAQERAVELLAGEQDYF